MQMRWKRAMRFLRKQFLHHSSESTTRQDETGQEGFASINETEPRDIFLVGYPKSGNTWMQHLIAGLVYGMDTRFLTDKLVQLIVPNVHGAKHFKRLNDVTFFKSHFLPQPSYRRVIYLVRDGRDAMVSYYHMLNAVSEEPVDFRAMVIGGTGLFPCKWHEHIEAWSENPFDAEILVVRYEDLHSDPIGEMQRVCAFADLDRDIEAIKRCVDGNCFSNMQTKEQDFGWDNSKWNSDEKFIRRGVVGSYKDEMPIELVNAFEQVACKELVGLGYRTTESV